MKRHFLICLLSSLAGGLPGATVYNLTTDWSNSQNPNGPWSLRQGSTILPYQSTACCGVQPGWAPGNVSGNFLPVFFRATGQGTTAQDWIAGDIVVHSTDAFNSLNPSQLATLVWTAPSAGTITFTGSTWYAQSALSRSTDFVISLNGLSLATGTVSQAGGSNRSNATAFSSSSALAVQAGDALMMTWQRSAGVSAGAFSGVRFQVTLDAVPEPATGALAAGALALVAFWKRRK